MKFKKAQGLPMNTIVIAAIVLVVLVVIVLIFTGGIGGWTKDVEEAGTLPRCGGGGFEGSWLLEEDCPTSSGWEIIPDFRVSDSNEDYAKGRVCCVKKTTE